jgi:hypothetical protein
LEANPAKWVGETNARLFIYTYAPWSLEVGSPTLKGKKEKGIIQAKLMI